MKETNLISILSAFKNLNANLFQSYLKYHSIKIKNDELEDLEVLVNHLKPLTKKINIFDKYFIGYTIPQIGKEFDLLRIDKESVVNIELKNNSTPEEIKKQILLNKYYLGFLKKEVLIFTYVADERKLYCIDEDQNLVEVNLEQLLAQIAAQDVRKIKDIDSFFNPSNYLVSPFNSTKKFIKGKYFLTQQQEEIKKSILTEINKTNYSILSIKGKAGTGKTLLTYDIAKKVNSVLIVHCGYLNKGQEVLRDNYAWKIIAINGLSSQDLSKYHLIIIDEAQRIRPSQLNHIISEIKKYSNNCIFSYDGQQTLKSAEINNNIGEKIEKETTIKPFELTGKIRMNKEVASFIRCLLNKNRPLEKLNYSNIELNYFNDYQESKNFLIQLKSEDWKIINYTPSTYHTLPYKIHNVFDEPDNAHTVIGQEFDNVVAVIDEHFYYEKGWLVVNYTSYYLPTKMLFQILSRTRIKLNIIIVNNQEILGRCLEILDQ